MRQIYFNGNIITMVGKQPEYVEAVFVEKGKIKKIGSKKELLQELEKEENKEIEKIDLKGCTMLPAFLDSHSHITALAQTLGIIDLSHCTSFSQIIATLKQEMKNRKIPKDDWIIGFGYDHNFLEEKRHPDKEVLDQVTNSSPILITHVSGHMGVVNSLGLEKLGITEKTKKIEGGNYGTIEGTNLPNGYLEERMFIEQTRNVLNISKKKIKEFLMKAQTIYLQNGITTVQDGLTKKQDFELLKELANENKWLVDVVSYLDYFSSKEVITENLEYKNKYHHRLKIGGYKMILDGSPQAKTAWVTEPYEGEESYFGYPTHTDEEVQKVITNSLRENLQLLTHCNGDAAADQLLHAFEKEKNTKEARPVMIHAQMVREDQLEQMKQIGMIPSFFVAHTYYWAEVHKQNLGKRAYRISPAKTAQKKGLIFTFHQDTPVLAPNMLETIWCAVNRKTKQGSELGKEEQIDVYTALKAITIYCAYQYFEEQTKGTIEEGKLADFVVLDKNPLTIEKEDIKQIQVLQTRKEGKVVYQKKID